MVVITFLVYTAHVPWLRSLTSYFVIISGLQIGRGSVVTCQAMQHSAHSRHSTHVSRDSSHKSLISGTAGVLQLICQSVFMSSSQSQFISMISSVGGRALRVPHVINRVPMQVSDVYLVCVGYSSKSNFNVMACNALHKPTAQRELTMVSKFTLVASYLNLCYICS